MCLCLSLADCWRRGTWRLQRSRNRGLNSCRERGGECWKRAASHINRSSSGNLNIQTCKFATQKVSVNSVIRSFDTLNSVPSQYSLQLFFCLHRKSKDDTWVSNNTYWELRKDPDFTHIDFPTLWWPLNGRSRIFFDIHSPFCDPGWFWWRLYSVLPSTFSTGLLYRSFIALIASAYI